MSSAMICTTCGTQYSSKQPLPPLCPICEDSRQYIPLTGQGWIGTEELQKQSRIRIQPLIPPGPALSLTGSTGVEQRSGLNNRPGLYALQVEPKFALGNRALLVVTKDGNILWDCIPSINEEIIQFIQALGGLKAIAISHPHYYSNMNDWAAAFDCPVFLHKLDEQWVMRKGPRLHFWSGDQLQLTKEIRIVHTGGHFPGSSILEAPTLSKGGTVLCGDSLYVARSKKHIAVMYSYPNQILLSREDFNTFEERMSAVTFDTLYGAFDYQDLTLNARQIYEKSMQLYKAAYQL
ncbi:MAG TPA: hypothetical protein VL053_17050 [Arachidicoccus sp.]|nr:hypothetical protein [Arachidicoccus sp.]